MNNLQLAAIECNKRWMATLPENPPEPEYSEEFHRNMAKLLDKMRGNRYHYFTKKTARVILVAAIVMSLLTVTVFAATDLGAYILDELRDHAIFQSLFEPKEDVDGKIDCGYIPDGFEMTKNNYDDNHCYLVYENSNDEHFSVTKRLNGDEIGLDNEETNKIVMYSTDKEFAVYEKDNGSIRIVWCDLNYTYTIDGEISIETALEIAENIK